MSHHKIVSHRSTDLARLTPSPQLFTFSGTNKHHALPLGAQKSAHLW